jgi:hypothetical protein
MSEIPKMVRGINTVQLEVDYKKAAAKLQGEFAAPTHFDGAAIDSSTVVAAPDGTITALLLTKRVDPELWEEGYEVAMIVNDLLDKRPTAVGSKAMARVKKDRHRGTFHVTPDRVMKILDRVGAREGLLGAMAGRAGRPPRNSKLTDKRPELLDQLRALRRRVDHLHAKYLPTPYAFQRAVVKEAPEFRLGHSAYSSVYIVKHLRSGYHRDRQNLHGALSALLPVGNFTGGELVLPRWRIAFAFKPGDVLFFDPQELHGNLPVVGDRASLVWYCARGLRAVK